MINRLIMTCAITTLFALSSNMQAADDASQRALLQQALDKQLAMPLPTADYESQHIAFVTRMIARQADAKPALAVAEKYWDTIIKSSRHDTMSGGFFSSADQGNQKTKTLLNQALISDILLDAVQIGGNDACRKAAHDTLNFVLRDLRLTTGGFAATLTTTPGVARDEALNPSANGLIVAALARGYVVLGNQEYYDAAAQTAELLLTQCKTADDCVSVIHGAIALYQVAGEARWLAAAISLQDRMDQEFWDTTTAQYRINEANHDAHNREIMNLLKLVVIVDDDGFKERAHALIASAIKNTGDDQLKSPGLLCAIDQQLGPTPHLTMVGDPTAADTRALFTRAHATYQPRLVIVTHAGDPIQKELRKRFPAMVPVPKVKGQATGYLCIGLTCNRPVTDPTDLEKQLAEVSYLW